MTLGQKLKKLRTEKGLTQKDLSDQLHVTFQTISKWESDTNEPDIATLKELAKFYGCSVDYLINLVYIYHGYQWSHSFWNGINNHRPIY